VFAAGEALCVEMNEAIKRLQWLWQKCLIDLTLIGAGLIVGMYLFRLSEGRHWLWGLALALKSLTHLGSVLFWKRGIRKIALFSASAIWFGLGIVFLREAGTSPAAAMSLWFGVVCALLYAREGAKT
jgi:hypothetical protein